LGCGFAALRFSRLCGFICGGGFAALGVSWFQLLFPGSVLKGAKAARDSFAAVWKSPPAVTQFAAATPTAAAAVTKFAPATRQETKTAHRRL
jgi:hypothetical protein